MKLVKIQRGTNQNRNNIGIHLFDPTKAQVASAKEDAANKGFHLIYVHRTRKVIVNRR